MNKGDYLGLTGGTFNGVTNNGGKGLLSGLNNISADRLNGFNAEDYGPMWGWWRCDVPSSLTLSSGLSAGANPYYCSRWDSIVREPVTGSFYYFRQTTVNQRPYLKEDEQGNKCLHFQTTGGFWMTGDLAGNQIGKDNVIIIVAKERGPITTNTYILGGRSATLESYLRTNVVTGQKRLQAAVNGTVNFTAQPQNIQEGNIAVYVLSSCSTDCFVRTNLNTKIPLTYSSQATNGYNLNSRFTGPNLPGDHNIYEMLVYKQPLSEDNYVRIFNYLQKKFKIVV